MRNWWAAIFQPESRRELIPLRRWRRIGNPDEHRTKTCLYDTRQFARLGDPDWNHRMEWGEHPIADVPLHSLFSQHETQ